MAIKSLQEIYKEIKDSREENIILQGFDEFSKKGFTQIPNLILRDPKLSVGAKITYSVLLSYAWNKESCFTGQEQLAKDMGSGQRSVIRFIKELEKTKYLKVKRRGQGKSNLYYLYASVSNRKSG